MSHQDDVCGQDRVSQNHFQNFALLYSVASHLQENVNQGSYAAGWVDSAHEFPPHSQLFLRGVFYLAKVVSSTTLVVSHKTLVCFSQDSHLFLTRLLLASLKTLSCFSQDSQSFLTRVFSRRVCGSGAGKSVHAALQHTLAF